MENANQHVDQLPADDLDEYKSDGDADDDREYKVKPTKEQLQAPPTAKELAETIKSLNDAYQTGTADVLIYINHKPVMNGSFAKVQGVDCQGTAVNIVAWDNNAHMVTYHRQN